MATPRLEAEADREAAIEDCQRKLRCLRAALDRECWHVAAVLAGRLANVARQLGKIDKS